MFRKIPTVDYDLPPLALELVEAVASLIANSSAVLTLPLPLLHDLSFTMLIDLLESSELQSPKYHGMAEEIPALVTDGNVRSTVANRMLFLGQLASHALCRAAELRQGR